MGRTSLERLCEPGQIGRVKTKNRMVKPAQSMHFASDDGYVTGANLGFYETIAKSGVGLILVEMAAVDYPVGYPSPKDLRIDADQFIPGLAQLSQIIHSHDVPTFLQLTHGGPPAAPAPAPGKSPQTPAPTISSFSVGDIEDIVRKFAGAAERAQKAGFDGVEVHGAHGYLIAMFLSRVWNKRQDRYGGTLENRARLACEVIRAIKERVGQDFPVGIRMNGAEYGRDDGTTLTEAQTMCRQMQESGANYIHVSAFGFGRNYYQLIHPEQIFSPEAPKPLGEGLDGSRKGPGALTLLAAGIKRVVSIPVITVGRLNPVLAEEVLREGRADFVALGRCLMADPEIIHKVMNGKSEDIRPCTACLTCIDRYTAGGPAVCRVNAALGKEREYAIRPAEKKKRVLIVGGGPAGMEAARVAALRGHEVLLYERQHKLGGAMLAAAVVKGTEVEDLVALVRYFEVQLSKLGVKVKLGKEVDEVLVNDLRPDVVILATGGISAVPEIPGINKRIVISQTRLHKMMRTSLRFLNPVLLRRLTKYYLPVPKRVLIMGGELQGIELAEFLIKRHRKVTVTETSSELGAGVVLPTKRRLFPWLNKNGAILLSSVKYEAITDKGLSLTTVEGQRQTIEADAILPALPLIPNTDLSQALKGKVRELYLIGDSREPHLIVDAIAEGFRTALVI